VGKRNVGKGITITKIEYCKYCGMSNTRPGIYFEDDICQGCLYEVEKNHIDWDARWKELKQFIKERPSKGKYDCVIAVSGGKDSYYQTYLFKEILGLNPLLVCVDDGFTKTKAGIHNLKNLQVEFDCDLFVYTMKAQTQKKTMRYTFEKYGRPCYIIHRLIYTVPIWVAIQFNAPIVVYGENIAVTRGLEDNRDIPTAWNQVHNSVASGISLEEIVQECDIDTQDLVMAQIPLKYTELITTPIYLSYFVRWDGYKNYQFAMTRGFKTLEGEWNRLGGHINYTAIDSYGYLISSTLKYAKFDHSYVTDMVCELIRTGHMDKDVGMILINQYEGDIDSLMLADFCNFLGYNHKEFFDIYNRYYKEGIHNE